MAGAPNSGAQMTFSYSQVWDDTVRLLRENARLLAAVAGVFLFFPALLVAQLLPMPETSDPNRVFQTMIEYYSEAWPWLFLQSLANMVGTAAMLRLVLARGTSVSAALAYGLMLLPFYFLLSFLLGLIVLFGILLLIVPGLYLVGRLAPAAPAMVAENRRDPLAAITRSFEITRGRGWAVFGLVFLVAVVGVIVTGVAAMLFGIAFILAGGPELGRLLTAILGSALNAVFATLFVTLYAAIYRTLTAGDSVAAAFE